MLHIHSWIQEASAFGLSVAVGVKNYYVSQDLAKSIVVLSEQASTCSADLLPQFAHLGSVALEVIGEYASCTALRQLSLTEFSYTFSSLTSTSCIVIAGLLVADMTHRAIKGCCDTESKAKLT